MPEPQINLSAAKPGECYRDRDGDGYLLIGRCSDASRPHVFERLFDSSTFAIRPDNGRWSYPKECDADLIAPFMSPAGGVYADSEGREWDCVWHREGLWTGENGRGRGKAGKFFDATGKSSDFDATGRGSDGTQLVRYLRPLPEPEKVAESNPSTPSNSSQPEPVQLREGAWERRDRTVVKVASKNFGPNSECHWEATDRKGERYPYPHDGTYRGDRQECSWDIIKYLGQRIIVSDEQAELLKRWDIDTLAAMVDMTEDEWDHLECVRENGGVDAYLDGIPQLSDAEAQHLAEVRAAGGVEAWKRAQLYSSAPVDGAYRDGQFVPLQLSAEEVSQIEAMRAAGGVEAWKVKNAAIRIRRRQAPVFPLTDDLAEESDKPIQATTLAADGTRVPCVLMPNLAPGEILASDGETPGVFKGPPLEPKSSRPVTVKIAERRRGEPNVQGFVKSQPDDNERQSAEPQPVAMREGWVQLRCGDVVYAAARRQSTPCFNWSGRNCGYSWKDNGRYLTSESDSDYDVVAVFGTDGTPVVLQPGDTIVRGRSEPLPPRKVEAEIDDEPQPRTYKWRHLTLVEGKTWGECGGKSDDRGEEFRQCWQEVKGAVVEYSNGPFASPIFKNHRKCELEWTWGDSSDAWNFDTDHYIAAARIISLPEQSREGVSNA